jgi:XTP/dITP diphosphohydrolase
MNVCICSSNRGKLSEFALTAQNLKPKHIVFVPLSNLTEVPPPAEDGSTFEENAVAKAQYYSRFTSEIVLADDSGLEVDALNGAPGVLSARYAGADASDEDNNNLLLRDLGNATHREARFVCVIALAQGQKTLTTARGVVEGNILLLPRGDQGFGYDPLFFYPPLDRSFGELKAEEKLRVSHRGYAIRRIVQWLENVQLTV